MIGTRTDVGARDDAHASHARAMPVSKDDVTPAKRTRRKDVDARETDFGSPEPSRVLALTPQSEPGASPETSRGNVAALENALNELNTRLEADDEFREHGVKIVQNIADALAGVEQTRGMLEGLANSCFQLLDDLFADIERDAWSMVNECNATLDRLDDSERRVQEMRRYISALHEHTNA